MQITMLNICLNYSRIEVLQASSIKGSPNPCGLQYNHSTTATKKTVFIELPQEVEERTGKQISWYLFELYVTPDVLQDLEDHLCSALLGLQNTEVRVALASFTEQIYR